MQTPPQTYSTIPSLSSRVFNCGFCFFNVRPSRASCAEGFPGLLFQRSSAFRGFEVRWDLARVRHPAASPWHRVGLSPVLSVGKRLPSGSNGKNLSVRQETRFNPWVGKFLWLREWQSTPVFLPGEFHGQRSLAAYSLCQTLLCD